jgi:uncharacterized protein with GYD domain
MCPQPHSGDRIRDLPRTGDGRFRMACVPDITDGKTMSKYFFEANYVGEGIKGLMREGGTKRREAVVTALESVGGSLDCMYYAFGDIDVLGVFEIPEPADAAALSLMINSSGAVNLRLKPLLSPEDLDAASKRTPSYRAPGQ